MCSPQPETRGRSGSDHKLGNKSGFDSDGETGEQTAGAKEHFQTQQSFCHGGSTEGSEDEFTCPKAESVTRFGREMAVL